MTAPRLIVACVVTLVNRKRWRGNWDSPGSSTLCLYPCHHLLLLLSPRILVKQASPTSLVLPPKESGAVLVRYQPKAMGKHQAAISCVVVPLSDGSSITAGQTLAMEVVETVGSCLHMAPKVPLPGGPDATPETFTKQR